MKLKLKKMHFSAARPVCIINKHTADILSLHANERVVIKKGQKKIISIVDTSSSMLSEDEIIVSDTIQKDLGLKDKDQIEIKIAELPQSTYFIRKKLNNEILSKEEIRQIIQDITNNALTEVEIAFFISAVHNSRMTLKETKYLIDAMVKSGNVLNLSGKIVDKHCIGGIAGNRTTPIVVSICAAAGLTMPKTSSRAITSAAGTADTIECLANVEFPIKEIKKIVRKTNACFVWGGSLGLAPADSKIIEIERIIHVDSDSQMLASILSKKLSVGSKYILIDIPYGRSAKVTKRKAKKLKEKFEKLGKMFDLKILVVLTDGREPIGNGVGPVLEMIDVIKVLRNDSSCPLDLKEKSIFLAGKILELSGKVKKNKGEILARKILESNKAYSKFNEIIFAQRGKIKTLSPGYFHYDVYSKKNLKIKHIDNRLLNTLARFSGCPDDKKAGVYLHKKKGDFIKRKEKILTIYANTKDKLKIAKKFYKKHRKQLIEFSKI